MNKQTEGSRGAVLESTGVEIVDETDTVADLRAEALLRRRSSRANTGGPRNPVASTDAPPEGPASS